MRSFTRSGAGGTKSARLGLKPCRDLVLWSQSLPAICGVVVASIRRRWILRTSFSRSGFAPAPRATGCSSPRRSRGRTGRSRRAHRAPRPRPSPGGVARGRGPRSGRTHGLGAQETPGEDLEAGHARRAAVQCVDRTLRDGNRGGDVRRERELEHGHRVGDEGAIPERAELGAPSGGGRVWGPGAGVVPSHGSRTLTSGSEGSRFIQKP
jgi:hypothetical protein